MTDGQLVQNFLL